MDTCLRPKPAISLCKGEGKWIKVPEDYSLNPAPEVKPEVSVQKLRAGGETAVAWKETRTKKMNAHTGLP